MYSATATALMSVTVSSSGTATTSSTGNTLVEAIQSAEELAAKEATDAAIKSLVYVPPEEKLVTIKILELNDTYDTNYFGQWGQFALDFIKNNETPDTTFVKVFSGNFLCPNSYSAIFQGHEMVLAANSCKFDVAVVGNHEFDYGDSILKELASMTTFPLVFSNALPEDIEKLNLISNYSFVKDGINFGVLGYVSPITPEITGGAKNIRFYDLDTMFNTYKSFLQNSDVRILLFREDINILIEYFDLHPEYTNLIDAVGRGSRNGEDFVTFAKYIQRYNSSYKIPLVNMGYNASGSGYMELSFNKATKKCVNSFVEVIPIDKNQPLLPEIIQLDIWKNLYIKRIFSEKIGSVFNYDLNGLQEQTLNYESNLADLIADANVYYIKTNVLLDTPQKNIFSFINGGSIRNNSIIPIGSVIEVGTVYTVAPFANYLCIIELTGITKVNKFLNYIAGVSKSRRGVGGWAQISKNLVFNYITNSYTLTGGSTSETEIFYCVTLNFLAAGNDGYNKLPEYNPIPLETIPSQVPIVSYIISLNGVVSYTNDYTRIIV